MLETAARASGKSQFLPRLRSREVREWQLAAAENTDRLQVLRDCSSSPPGSAAAVCTAAAS